MSDDRGARDWAEDVFGHAELGDSRRTRRLVQIAAEAAARPGGRVLEVCRSGATRQGAYDFLSNRKIAPSGVQAAVTKATALGCEGEEYCFVVVDVRETGTVPRNGTAIHWRLLTNRPIATDEDVLAILRGYTQRWKIEEFHRTWKSGACRVEESQLRSADAVMKWAIVMAATASRIERLKCLARNEPTIVATREFTVWEIQAAIVPQAQIQSKKPAGSNALAQHR